MGPNRSRRVKPTGIMGRECLKGHSFVNVLVRSKELCSRTVSVTLSRGLYCGLQVSETEWLMLSVITETSLSPLLALFVTRNGCVRVAMAGSWLGISINPEQLLFTLQSSSQRQKNDFWWQHWELVNLCSQTKHSNSFVKSNEMTIFGNKQSLRFHHSSIKVGIKFSLVL